MKCSRLEEMDNVMYVVVKHSGLPWKLITCKTRLKQIVIWRMIFSYICKTHLDATLEEIADYLGMGNHTSIMHHIKEIRNKIDINSRVYDHFTHVDLMRCLDMLNFVNEGNLILYQYTQNQKPYNFSLNHMNLV